MIWKYLRARQKAAHIKLLIFDVDGVLTDNKITFDSNGNEIKFFNIQDGMGFKLAQKAGLTIAVITGRSSDQITQRMNNLGVQHVYQGCEKKTEALEDLAQKLKINYDAMLYVGDDVLDIPVMQKVALPIAVKNALPAVKRCALWQTKKKGGEGAAREVCDWVLRIKKVMV